MNRDIERQKEMKRELRTEREERFQCTELLVALFLPSLFGLYLLLLVWNISKSYFYS